MKQLFLVWFMIIASTAFSQVYVAPTGSDHNDGSREKPFATVAMAVRKAREMRRLNDVAIQKGIDIVVEDGTYNFTEPLFIRPEDSGTDESPTTVKAAPGAHPVFSGGIRIEGWKKVQSRINGLSPSTEGKIWMADISSLQISHLPFRQLWVNDVKAIRAKEVNGDSMKRILSWDHASQTCWVPKPKNVDLSKTDGMEMFIHQWWAIAILRIKSIKVLGDSMQLTFHQPESRIQSEHPWPAPWLSKKTGNSAFYLSNSIQFLNEPGEWYFDQRAGKIYYYPRSNENMLQASVIAPMLETLVVVKGTIDRPVTNFHINGISFQYTGWTRPSAFGHVPLQAGMYMLDAYKLKVPGTPDKKGLENQAWIGRPAAAVEVSYANHTGFELCRFEHLASTGLDYKRGTSHDEIVGNLFKDIGGSGMLIGTFSDESVETHLPYNPRDEREICSEERINNNLVTDVSNEDWGCVGIGAGYVRGINIEHNEVCNVSYTGISLGWGWTKTENALRDDSVIANKITHYAKHMYDVAGIYTLSAQPGTLVQYNSIDSIYLAPYAHDPNHWFYLYADEGSSYIVVRDNWCPSEKFLQNANGPGNFWYQNGPMNPIEIKQQAGLEKTYSFLLQEKTVDRDYSINHFTEGEQPAGVNQFASFNMPVVVEVKLKQSGQLLESQLLRILGEHNVKPAEVNKWQNHYAAYSYVNDTSGLRTQIASTFSGSEVKFYSKLVYLFDREYCTDNNFARELNSYLFTANLVNEPRLQQEYIDYHAKQFQQWPEVARGFCNAEFQRLLVLRNGRQLMLLISVPKGKTLDELNPKTVENNPRMVQWNELMKKYQEGIEGTKPGEVWVQFLPIIK